MTDITVKAFARRTKKLGLNTYQEIGDAFGVDPSAVGKWMRGVRGINATVVLLLRCYERNGLL